MVALSAGRLPLQQVATRPDGPDGKAQRGNPASEPQHMHVKGIATRRAVRPARNRQLATVDHRLKPADQRTHDPSLNRRQGNPRTAKADHPISINLRRRNHRRRHPAAKNISSGSNVVIRRRHTHPVLKGVVAHRRWVTRSHKQQAGPAPGCKGLSAIVLMGPAQQFDFHPGIRVGAHVTTNPAPVRNRNRPIPKERCLQPDALTTREKVGTTCFRIVSLR